MAAPVVEGADYIALHPAVDSGNAKGSPRGGGLRIEGIYESRKRFRCPGVPAADPGDGIGRKYCMVQERKPFRKRHIRIRDQGFSRSVVPDGPGQGTGIHAADSGDSIFLHHLPQCLHTAEIGWLIIIFAHDQGSDRGCNGFIVLCRHTVIADQRISHNDRLVRVGQIRQNLLIACHGSVENNLAYPVFRGAKGISVKFPSVLQDDLSLFLFFHDNLHAMNFVPERACRHLRFHQIKIKSSRRRSRTGHR